MLSLLQTRALVAATPYVQREESCVLSVYDDGNGNATVGWGSTFYEDGIRVHFGDPDISQARADSLLRSTMEQVVLSICDKLLRTPTPNQLAAMICLSYNIGLASFATSSVLAYFNAGDADGAHAAFALWNKVHKPGGPLEVSTDLVRRRAREMVLFETPWTDPVGAPQPPADLLLPAPSSPDAVMLEYRAILVRLANWQGLSTAQISVMETLAYPAGREG